MREVVLELSGSILSLSHEEKCLLALLTHVLLAFEETLHDLLELLLEGVGLAFEQFVTLLGSGDLLLVELEVPEWRHGYIRLAVI
jgi:hypothetical protein